MERTEGEGGVRPVPRQARLPVVRAADQASARNLGRCHGRGTPPGAVSATAQPPGYEEDPECPRAEITALHPRPDFKRRILQAFTDGIAPRPDTTFGNVKADVLDRFTPGYRRANFVDIIEGSDWPE